MELIPTPIRMLAGPRAAAAICAAMLGSAGSAPAQEPADTGAPLRTEAASEESPARPPAIGLDQLLRLPSDVQYDVDRRKGGGRAEWRERFRKAVQERDDAERALQESRDELADIAAQTDGWNLGAPGTSGAVDPDAPLSFELKQRIRRQRRELDAADERLRALEVQANLAGIPEEWRDPGPEPEEKSSEARFEP